MELRDNDVNLISDCAKQTNVYKRDKSRTASDFRVTWPNLRHIKTLCFALRTLYCYYFSPRRFSKCLKDGAMAAETIKFVVILFAFTDRVVWVSPVRLAAIWIVLSVKVAATMSV